MKAITILFIFSGFLLAQETTFPSSATAPPANARYEIIQSPIVARDTFKLDRYTGRVWQMVNAKDHLDWEEMFVFGRPLTESISPRFQIILSGIAARWTFLIDCSTGTTWIRVEDGWTLLTNAKP